jgi:hypothetical protein
MVPIPADNRNLLTWNRTIGSELGDQLQHERGARIRRWYMPILLWLVGIPIPIILLLILLWH